ncbi:MAG: hypothetical protein ACO2OO_00875 [Candidatus Aenigmatarchaeota archaeon]|jgi:hypothetical protein
MFIISFDLPREMNSARVRLFRMLKSRNCKMIHESLWEGDNLKDLIEIASFIKKFGGRARILEEKFLF